MEFSFIFPLVGLHDILTTVWSLIFKFRFLFFYNYYSWQTRPHCSHIVGFFIRVTLFIHVPQIMTVRGLCTINRYRVVCAGVKQCFVIEITPLFFWIALFDQKSCTSVEGAYTTRGGNLTFKYASRGFDWCIPL